MSEYFYSDGNPKEELLDRVPKDVHPYIKIKNDAFTACIKMPDDSTLLLGTVLTSKTAEKRILQKLQERKILNPKATPPKFLTVAEIKKLPIGCLLAGNPLSPRCTITKCHIIFAEQGIKAFAPIPSNDLLPDETLAVITLDPATEEELRLFETYQQAQGFITQKVDHQINQWQLEITRIESLIATAKTQTAKLNLSDKLVDTV